MSLAFTTAGDEPVYVAKKEPVPVRDQAGCTFAIVQADEAYLEEWPLGKNRDSWQMIDRARAQAQSWITAARTCSLASWSSFSADPLKS